MKSKTWFVCAASLLVLCMCLSANAQDKKVTFGLQANWSDDADFGIGGRVIVNLDQVTEGLEGVGSFDYFFPSTDDDLGLGTDVDVTYWEMNANAVYKFKLENSSLKPYVGAGLNIAHGNVGVAILEDIDISASDTEVGLNILGGVLYNDRFFAEAKFEAGGGESFVLSAGVRF